jgi:hypothetical protein
MIRLRRPTGDERSRSLSLRFRNKEFQLAGFVPAKGKTCLVVAFDIYLRPAEMLGKAGEMLDRGGKMGEV